MDRKRKSESKRNRISFFVWSDRLVCEWNVIFEDATTVVTGDGKASAHFEHSIAITNEGPYILTALTEDLAVKFLDRKEPLT